MITTNYNEFYDTTTLSKTTQIKFNTDSNKNIILYVKDCDEKHDNFNRIIYIIGKTLTFYNINICKNISDDIYSYIANKIIHTTLTCIANPIVLPGTTHITHITHIVSIRLKNIWSINNQDTEEKTIKYNHTINNYVLIMTNGKIDFKKMYKHNNGEKFKFPIKELKYILYLVRNATLRDDGNIDTARIEIAFNDIIYIFSENFETNNFERITDVDKAFPRKILYFLYNIDFITFTNNYLKYIIDKNK